MVDESGMITVTPQIMLLEQVLAEIASGRLRVPKFQRPFVWRPEQMLNLFDSIERGYPIGSLLVWDTSLPLPSLDRLADIEIPPPADGTTSFLLDGHQRFSTLFGSLLRRPTASAASGQREWMWHIYRVLGDRDERSDRFRHWKQVGEPPPTYLPMRAVLRTMDFLAYSRRLSDAVGDSAMLDALVEEAEQLAHRIKSYQVAVVRLQGGDLRHAVEVFSRLNSSGQAMTPDQMVSALTYQAEGESLADQITAIREGLSSIGYGPVAPITVFRSILAVAGEDDVQDARWEKLAGRVERKLAEAVENTDQAMRRAVRFLRNDVGVPLARLVPYQLQIMLLTACFHHNPEPSAEQLEKLTRWFWGTSWSGFFAGANSTQVKNALQEMQKFAKGDAAQPWDPQPARPFPNKFDLRSARVRAFILWELRHFNRRLTPNGNKIDPVEVLARSDTEAYQHVVREVPSASHPANRLILTTEAGVSVRRAMLNMPPGIEEPLLVSHGVPLRALERLRSGDGEGFITERAEALINWERAFMAEMGAEASAEDGGEADIDTE
jgi:Uncharacterized conserved protein